MLPYRDSKVTRIAIIAFFVLAALYAYYEVQGLLYGPRINVPAKVMEVREQVVAIRGSAVRIAELKMNGKAIPVTEEGAFEEPYVLAEGYNRVILEASDKYGRVRKQTIEIVYIPSTEDNATSTPAIAPES